MNIGFYINFLVCLLITKFAFADVVNINIEQIIARLGLFGVADAI